jgi:hypothetical protein
MPSLGGIDGADFFTSFDGLGEFLGDGCLVPLEGVLEIPRGRTIKIGAGCLVVLKANARIEVRGALEIIGTPTNPVVIVGEADEHEWETIHVSGRGATLKAKFAFFSGSGVKGRLQGDTGRHHTASAAVTITDSAKAVVMHSFLVDNKGPAFAVGSRGSLHVKHSVIQNAEMGIECLQCEFLSEYSLWANFPSWDGDYADNDNDGMYLSGGDHRIQHSVVAHTKDDGIDSGTPENSKGDGGSMLIDRTIIEMCQHEGVALSSSRRGERSVKIVRSAVQWCQQGIESGYSGNAHRVEIDSCLVANTLVALRFGDNYYNRPQLGGLKGSRVTLLHNWINAMNYVRQFGASQKTSVFSLDANSAVFPRMGKGVGSNGCADIFGAATPNRIGGNLSIADIEEKILALVGAPPLIQEEH